MPNELNMTLFSKRLKEARTDKNMTQKELSEKSGVSTVMISAYERSNTNSGKNPALNNIYAIAMALGVSIDWLCGLTDNTNVDNADTKEITPIEFLHSMYYLVKNCNITSTNTSYNGIVNYIYEININQNCFAYDFIEDCQKLKEALQLDILDNEMKQNLINGVIEKYLKKVDNNIDELFKNNFTIDDDDLPF